MDFIEQLPQMVAFLKKLVEIESPSHEKAAVDQVGSLLAEECRRLEAQVVVHPQTKTGNQIEARFLGSTEKPGILLLCHMDTVFPLESLKKMPFHEKDGKIFGPGVSDMKGGIVVALSALAAAAKERAFTIPVTALFTSDEELGSDTARALIEDLAKKSSLVLVLEPGMVDGALKTWRKGVGDFRVTVHGRAAHAGGDHQNGRNAIEEMAHQVIAIQKLTDYDRGTTLNVGTIRGGIASNVVPDEAFIDVDVRVMLPGEAERIGLAMNALKPVLDGTTLSVTGGLNRPPMPFSDLLKATFERVKGIAAGIGLELKASGTGGASDANFVAPLGIPVLDGLGPAGGDYHSEREYIFQTSLAERASLLTAILKQWESG